RVDLRGIPHVPPPRRKGATESETSVRGLAGAWLAPGNSPVLSPSLWHRKQLPSTTASADVHLHARPAPAIGVRGHLAAAAKYMGLDSRNLPQARVRREQNLAIGTPAFQTLARLDQSSRHRPTP